MILDILGDWLTFDGQNVASIAHVPAGVRMHLEEIIRNVPNDTVQIYEMVIHKVVLNETGTIVNGYPDTDHEPALPDGHTVVEVVQVGEVKDTLTKANVAWE